MWYPLFLMQFGHLLPLYLEMCGWTSLCVYVYIIQTISLCAYMYLCFWIRNQVSVKNRTITTLMMMTMRTTRGRWEHQKIEKMYLEKYRVNKRICEWQSIVSNYNPEYYFVTLMLVQCLLNYTLTFSLSSMHLNLSEASPLKFSWQSACLFMMATKNAFYLYVEFTCYWKVA